MRFQPKTTFQPMFKLHSQLSNKSKLLNFTNDPAELKSKPRHSLFRTTSSLITSSLHICLHTQKHMTMTLAVDYRATLKTSEKRQKSQQFFALVMNAWSSLIRPDSDKHLLVKALLKLQLCINYFAFNRARCCSL